MLPLPLLPLLLPLPSLRIRSPAVLATRNHAGCFSIPLSCLSRVARGLAHESVRACSHDTIERAAQRGKEVLHRCGPFGTAPCLS